LDVPGVDERCDGRLARDEVVAEQQDPFVFAGHGQHHYCADDGKDGDEGDGEAFATPACSRPRRAEDANDLDDAEGDVKEDGFEVRIAKVFDDEVAEGGDTATCDTTYT
jgi:hypothetical protein